MQILVTGATGFAGSYLSEQLIGYGHMVYGLIHQESSHQPYPSHLRFMPISGDILSVDDVQQAFKISEPEIVYHLAGQPSPVLSWDQPARTFAINTGGTVNVLKGACQYGLPRVVVVTSAQIYGRLERTDAKISETTNPSPIDPYGVSKWAAGKLVGAYFKRYQLPAIEARPFNRIGPRQTRGFVVPDFASQIASIKLGLAEPIIKVGNLSAQRDFTDVRDVAQAYHEIGMKGQAGETYLVCSGKAVPIRQIVDQLIALSGLEIKVELDPARFRQVEVKSVSGDYSKLHSQTGWQPTIPLERSLRDVYEEWLQRLSK